MNGIRIILGIILLLVTVLFFQSIQNGNYDEDNDGIINLMDECPMTPMGANVDSSGCLITLEFTNSLGMEFVLIPKGEFNMGSNPNEKYRYSDEGPLHPVKISRDFYLGKYEVTQKQWLKVMGNKPSYVRNCDSCPVESVSWNEVHLFIKRLNQLEDTDKYRLPTEAEWEYAARAGTTKPYSFSHDVHFWSFSWFYSPTDTEKIEEYAWYNGNSEKRSHAVGQKISNPWGIYDVHGNVWEFIEDWYGEYPSEPVTDPLGPLSGSYKVARGGSWLSSSQDCRSAFRFSSSPDYTYRGLGFRLAMTKGE